MTRINLVPPEILTDQHLFAEFREIKMVPKALKRSLASAYKKHGNWPGALQAVKQKVGREFTLNKGHVTFFYDKGRYLQRRYNEICKELRRRKINYNRKAVFDNEDVFKKLVTAQFRLDYWPTDEALELIEQRIQERIDEKPEWYRHYGRPIFKRKSK